MPPGRSVGGGSSSRSRGGAGFRRGSGGRGRGRGRGGRGGARGRGTALPSAFASKAGDARDHRHGSSGAKGGDAGYEFEDKAERVSDRHKYDDDAGESDAGPDPDDSDFEDEEVDENEAFNSGDENRYGDLMETILERRNGKPGGGSGGDESSDRAEDSGDDDLGEDGGMSLMDMLNSNEAKEEGRMANGSVGGSQNMAMKTGERQQKNVARGGGARAGDEVHTAPASVSSGGSEEEFSDHDEDSSGDDAMDDERKRGEVDHDSESSDDEESDEEDENERHARLLGFVESLGERTAVADRAAEDRLSSQLLQEGEFNSTAAAAAGINNGITRKGGITMEALMGSLQDTKGFAAVKRQVAAFSGKTGTPSAPTSKAAELRAEREAAYESRKRDMGKWVAPVQANRQSETLDFSESVKTNLSNAAMASKLKPTTDLEREVEMLLTAGGALEANVAEREREELKAKVFTVEEVKERQAELSKMRALMFYQERKQHHMNKIKSKVYRKIKKRQRDRAGEAELEASGELEEVKARKRAEERMSLRHKNTTKWVKNALRARGGAGQDDRRAISEQLRLGQELRAKMDGVDKDGDSESDESSSDDGAGNNDEGASKRRKSALRASDRAALLRIGQDGEEDADDEAVSGKGSALLKMAFMQKAMDKQRKKAKEEASMLLKELESASAAADMEDDEGSSDDAGPRNGESNKNMSNPKGKARPNTTASREAQAKAAAEIAKALPSGTLQTTAVSMDSSAKSSVGSPITIHLGGTNTSEPTNDRENRWNGGDSGELPLAEEGDRQGQEPGASMTASLNRKSDGKIAASMVKESESAKRRRDNVPGEINLSVEQSDGARRQANGPGDQSDGGEVEGAEMSDGHEEEEDGRENPWLAPTPGRSSDRRRASANTGGKGCDVVLDVRKAAATALSVFAPSDGQAEAATTGAAPSPASMVAGEGEGTIIGGNDAKHASNRSEDGVGTKKRKGPGETVGGSGRSKRRRGAGTGGDGAGGGSSSGARGQGEGGGRKSNSSGDVGGHQATVKIASQSQTDSKKNCSESKNQAKKKKKKERKEKKSSGGLKPRAEAAAPQRKLGGLSNDELVRRAFAAPDFETEFKASKDDEVDAAVSKGRDKLPGDIAGWGSWTGEGAKPPSAAVRKRRLEAEAIQAKKEEKLKKARKDDRLPKVVINEKRQKRSAKYMVSEVPYPFTSREQYERSLRQPIGGEWNTSQSVQALTKPAVIVRPGAVVKPMKLGKLHREIAKEKQAVYAAGKSVGEKRGRGAARGGTAKVASGGDTGRSRRHV